MRAREKEVVKRRLAALAAAQPRRRRARRRQRARASTASPASRAASIALDRAAQRAVVPARALARRVGRDQLPALLRRQPARRAADGRSGGVRRGAPLRVRAGAARRRHRACASITSTACSRRATTCGGCRSACAEAPDRRRSPFFIVVEKILGAGRAAAGDWPVHGTTGYEFAAIVNNLFVDRRQRARARRHLPRASSATRERLSFDDLAYRSKKQVLHETMSGDINSLGHQLNRFSERNRHFRDFTLYSLISTLKEVIACFPVYRTYITADEPVSEHDRRYIARGGPLRAGGARRRSPALVFDFVERLLLKQTRGRRRRRSARSARGSSASSSRSPARSRRRASRTRRSTSTTGCSR